MSAQWHSESVLVSGSGGPGSTRGPRAAGSGRFVPQLNDLATPSSRGCGGVGVRHLATHFCLISRFCCLMNMHVCNKEAISYMNAVEIITESHSVQLNNLSTVLIVILLY